MLTAPAVGAPGGLTLGEVVRAALPHFTQSHRLPLHHWKALRAIAACRTPALGGHQYVCTHCGADHFVPHSCGNRHCPTCQGTQAAQWLEKQVGDLLPIPYFHLVFTLPHELNPLIEYNQRALYALLFKSATATLLEFGRHQWHASLGITAVLHTWGQTLIEHYHLHCIVTGGGLALDGSAWVPSRRQWLFAVRARSVVFRAKFQAGLQRLFDDHQLQFPAAQPRLADPAAFARWMRRAGRHKWVVYSKRPFAGPQAALAYLCRYTHRVAITNARFQALDPVDRTVTFSYKDYAHAGTRRAMTLDLDEFLRRFCRHILPPRFVKIRTFGFLANRHRAARLAQVRGLLAADQPGLATAAAAPQPFQSIEHRPLVCPRCGRPTLILVARIPRPTRPIPALLDSS